VFDPKGRLTLESWALVPWEKGYPLLQKGQDCRVRVGPPGIDVPDEYAYWHDYFKLVFQLTNVIVYVDELYQVGKPTGSPGLRSLYALGRELGIGVWSCVQRPAQIPKFAMTEAEWIIMFQLRDADDIDRMVSLIGPEAKKPLKGHSFLVFNDHMEHPKRYAKAVVKKR
jgi:hypothetical protein